MLKKRSLVAGLAIMGMLAFSGCSSKSSSSTQLPETAFNGVFVDSAVDGVHFECGTVSGETHDGGIFGTCEAGAVATFSIGNLIIGSSSNTSDGVFFVTDLVGTSRDDVSNDEVLKIAVVLQSLDKDGDPSNGITVPPEAAAAIDALGVKPGDTLEEKSDEFVLVGIGSVVTTLLEDYPDMEYVPVEEAEANLEESLELIDDGAFTPPPVTGAS